MKKERPPCEGGPPQQNLGSTLPLGVNGSGIYFSAVTASTLAIDGLANLQAYSAGTNGDYQNDKLKKPTYYRMCVDSYADIDPRLDDASRRLLGVMHTLKRPDGLVIAGKEKLACYRRKSPRRIYAYLRKLCAAGYLRLVKRGGGYPGNADAYSLGVMYTQEKAEWCAKQMEKKRQKWAEMEKERWSKMTIFEGQRWSEIGTKGGNRLPSHPIDTSNNTHTKEPLWAFSKENWKTYCLELNPKRDLADIGRTFDKAEREGAKDGDWQHRCRFYNSHYKAPVKTASAQVAISPKIIVRQSKPKKWNPLSTEGCNSPPAYRCAGFNSFAEWQKAGYPNSS